MERVKWCSGNFWWWKAVKHALRKEAVVSASGLVTVAPTNGRL